MEITQFINTRRHQDVLKNDDLKNDYITNIEVLFSNKSAFDTLLTFSNARCDQSNLVIFRSLAESQY